MTNISSFRRSGHWHSGETLCEPLTVRDYALHLNTVGCSQDQGIPPSATREELRKYARGEFERNRNVTDIVGHLNAVHISLLTIRSTISVT